MSRVLNTKRIKSETKTHNSIEPSKEGFEACKALFSRPGWSCTWVLQEVTYINPVQVHISHLKLDLNSLARLCSAYLSTNAVADRLKYYTYILDSANGNSHFR
jgi:hypothetical protein